MSRSALVVFLLVACGGADEAPVAQPHSTQPESSTEEPAPSTEEPAETLDSGLRPFEEATPTTLRIINDRSEAIRLTLSFGDGQPFAIRPREGFPEYRLGGSGPVIAEASCECRCGWSCMECEHPLLREQMLEPGEHHDFAWSGRVRVYTRGCFEPYAAPRGEHTFEACLGDFGDPERHCVEVQASLPTDRIEFHFD